MHLAGRRRRQRHENVRCTPCEMALPLRVARTALTVIKKKAGKFATRGKITGPCGQAIQQAIDAALQAVAAST